MTAASLASVLALPGVRSAVRRTGQPGQVAHDGGPCSGPPPPPAGPLVVAGWPGHHQQAPVGRQLVVEGVQTRLVVGQGLVTGLLGVCRTLLVWCFRLPWLGPGILAQPH